jgi:hypothetical protein
MCNGKIFLIQVAVVKLKCPVVAVVPAALAYSTFVVDAELFELALTLNGLFIHARLAVGRVAGFASASIEFIKGF